MHNSFSSHFQTIYHNPLKSLFNTIFIQEYPTDSQSNPNNQTQALVKIQPKKISIKKMLTLNEETIQAVSQTQTNRSTNQSYFESTSDDTQLSINIQNTRLLTYNQLLIQIDQFQKLSIKQNPRYNLRERDIMIIHPVKSLQNPINKKLGTQISNQNPNPIQISSNSKNSQCEEYIPSLIEMCEVYFELKNLKLIEILKNDQIMRKFVPKMLPKQTFLREVKSIVIEHKEMKYGRLKMSKKLKNSNFILEHFNKQNIKQKIELVPSLKISNNIIQRNDKTIEYIQLEDSSNAIPQNRGIVDLTNEVIGNVQIFQLTQKFNNQLTLIDLQE